MKIGETAWLKAQCNHVVDRRLICEPSSTPLRGAVANVTLRVPPFTWLFFIIPCVLRAVDAGVGFARLNYDTFSLSDVRIWNKVGFWNFRWGYRFSS